MLLHITKCTGSHVPFHLKPFRVFTNIRKGINIVKENIIFSIIMANVTGSFKKGN